MTNDSDRPAKILLVDDNPMTVNILCNSLDGNYEKHIAVSGEEALDLLEASDTLPDLIILDILMQGIDGYQVCKVLKANSRFLNIPVIFLSSLTDEQSKIHAFKYGAADYIEKPFRPEEIKSRVDVQLKISALQRKLEKHNKYLNELVIEKVAEISDIQLSTIYALVKLADYRDDILGLHLQRTQLMCKKIAEVLSMSAIYQPEINDDFIENIYKASPLHDIGKVGIPDRIYFKPGKLSFDEFEVMKTHANVGAAALQAVLNKFPNNEFLRMGINIANYHHEKWNGLGYPDGLKGPQIPLCARIMAISDVYDALRTQRPYKKAYSHEESFKIIIEGRGSHFDPIIIDAFIEIEDWVMSLY
ncbi:MAG: HD domain-containing phosphohydrolase [Eubacteriales bacterium]